MKIVLHAPIKVSVDNVVAGFDKQLFEALKPPLLALNVDRFDGCHKGDEVHLSMGFGPIKQKWISTITHHEYTEQGFIFIDEGTKLPPPLKYWKHKHIIAKQGNYTQITDDIHYSSNNKLIDIVIYPFLYAMFYIRIPIYKRYFSE